MEWTGMLVVSSRGINFGFWSRKMSLFLAVKVSLRVAREKNNKTEIILILYIYPIHINKVFHTIYI